MLLHKTLITLITLDLVSSLRQPEPGINVNININVNKNGVPRDGYVGVNHDKYDMMNDGKEDLLDTSVPLPAVPVPCKKYGGQIQSKMCCPWYSDNPDLCTEYDACVCKEGFVGDECEHDCSMGMCPYNYAPVCGAMSSDADGITFGNKCQFLTSKCDKEYDGLYFLYDGECQNNTLCPRIMCPMDVDVVYYDNPEMPGCKLCAEDPKAPCY